MYDTDEKAKADIIKRNAEYANRTIEEQLTIINTRRGESKKERARLEKYLELKGVVKNTKILGARLLIEDLK